MSKKFVTGYEAQCAMVHSQYNQYSSPVCFIFPDYLLMSQSLCLLRTGPFSPQRRPPPLGRSLLRTPPFCRGLLRPPTSSQSLLLRPPMDQPCVSSTHTAGSPRTATGHQPNAIQHHHLRGNIQLYAISTTNCKFLIYSGAL